MSAARIRATLAELREAGARLRERPAAEILEALGSVLETWREPCSALREELAKGLPEAAGFSEPTVREGLELALQGWSRDALHALVARELGGSECLDVESAPGTGATRGPRARPVPSGAGGLRAPGGAGGLPEPGGAGALRMVSGFETTALLLAGSLPSPTLLAMLAPLVLRSPLLVKPAARDPLTARVVARSLADADAGLGACVAVVPFESHDEASLDACLAADCVVATGSDATVASVAARVAPPRRAVLRGHRLSLAALGPGALRGEALARAVEALALDVTLWDQQGCLSPLALFVAGAERAAVDRVAERLAECLERAERLRPRGRIEPAAAAAIAHERAQAELRAAAGQRVALHAGPGTSWTVVREADASLRPAPLHRFVRVQPAAGVAALLDGIRPLGPHLAAVGVAGFGAATPALAQALGRLGASRVCPLGRMQAPPLAWCHDGQGVLLPLARLTDLERE